MVAWRREKDPKVCSPRPIPRISRPQIPPHARTAVSASLRIRPPCRLFGHILLPFLFVRSESMPRFTTSCLRTSYSCDISPIGTIVGSATAAF